jgi:hypothetical protein
LYAFLAQIKLAGNDVTATSKRLLDPNKQAGGEKYDEVEAPSNLSA